MGCQCGESVTAFEVWSLASRKYVLVAMEMPCDVTNIGSCALNGENHQLDAHGRPDTLHTQSDRSELPNMQSCDVAGDGLTPSVQPLAANSGSPEPDGGSHSKAVCLLHS